MMGIGRWKRMGDGNMAWRLWCGRCGAVGEIVGKKQSGGFTALSFLPLLSLPQTYFLFPNQAARC